MADDSWRGDFARTVQQHRAQGWGWRYDGLADWSTDRIFAQLRELGIDADNTRFHDEAAEAKSFEPLTEKWTRQIREDKRSPGFWEDFPFLAVMALWLRLAADVVCRDSVEHRMHQILRAEEEGKELPDENGLPAGLAAALGLARFLRGIEPSQREDEFIEIENKGIWDYSDWLLEELECHCPEYPEVVGEIAEVLWDCRRDATFRSALAITLAMAERREQAVGGARALLADFPGDSTALIGAGDVFQRLGDKAEALRIWREALPLVKDGWEWETLIDRLEYHLEQAGRSAELDELIKAHPQPPMPEEEPEFEQRDTWEEISELEDRTSQQLTSARLIGRNEPCPCGSGKKYKKCCMP